MQESSTRPRLTSRLSQSFHIWTLETAPHILSLTHKQKLCKYKHLFLLFRQQVVHEGASEILYVAACSRFCSSYLNMLQMATLTAVYGVFILEHLGTPVRSLLSVRIVHASGMLHKPTYGSYNNCVYVSVYFRGQLFD